MKNIIALGICIFAIGCSGNKKETEISLEDLGKGKINITSDKMQVDDNISPFIRYGVTGEYKVSIAPDGIETAITREIGANIVSRNNPYGSIERNLALRRLSKAFIVKCSACHDDYGNGVIGPSLLSKSSDEIYQIILKYKTAEEANVLMKRLVDKMDDKEIRLIAEDISKFNKEVHSE